MFDRVHRLFLFPGLEVRGVAVSEIRCCLSLFLRPHTFAAILKLVHWEQMLHAESEALRKRGAN